MSDLVTYFQSRTNGYFAKKNVTPPAATTGCGSGAGIDFWDAGVPPQQVPAPDASTVGDSGIACYNDGNICEYPTNDAGAMKLPPAISGPVTDSEGNPIRFVEQFPGARFGVTLIGNNLKDVPVLKVCFGLDSTQLGPSDSPDVNLPIPVALGNYSTPYITNIAPANAWQSCQADPSNPADPFAVYENVAAGVKFENLKHCPWNADYQLPAFGRKQVLSCNDLNGDPIAILPTEAEKDYTDANNIYGFPFTVPAPNGTLNPDDPNVFCATVPRNCYDKDGTLIGTLDVYWGTDNRQSNGTDSYLTYWWARAFARNQ